MPERSEGLCPDHPCLTVIKMLSFLAPASPSVGDEVLAQVVSSGTWGVTVIAHSLGRGGKIAEGTGESSRWSLRVVVVFVPFQRLPFFKRPLLSFLKFSKLLCIRKGGKGHQLHGEWRAAPGKGS